MLAGSITRSTRGSSGGGCPRLRFGLRAASALTPRSAASAFSCAASSTPWASSASSSSRVNWSGDSFSELLPNCARCDVRGISSSRRLASCTSASAASTSARRDFRDVFSRARASASMGLSESWSTLFDQQKQGFPAPRRPHPAASGRRARSGRTSRQSSPSNNAASCADDIRITPSRAPAARRTCRPRGACEPAPSRSDPRPAA